MHTNFIKATVCFISFIFQTRFCVEIKFLKNSILKNSFMLFSVMKKTLVVIILKNAFIPQV